jgi:hypothetical protein
MTNRLEVYFQDMEFIPIKGMGEIQAPLGTVRLGDGRVSLLVNPWAAIGTDILGLSLSVVVFTLAKQILLRLLALGSSIWFTTAALIEVGKLLSGPPDQDVVVREK